MKAYSDDLREKVLKALEKGQMPKDVAVRFDVSISWVYKIKKRFEVTGNYQALHRSGRPRKYSEDDVRKISEIVKKKPSATLKEIRQLVNFRVGITTIHRILRDILNFTYKKSPLRSRTKPGRCNTKA